MCDYIERSLKANSPFAISDVFLFTKASNKSGIPVGYKLRENLLTPFNLGVSYGY